MENGKDSALKSHRRGDESHYRTEGNWKGEPALSRDHDTQLESFSIPEFAVSRSGRQHRILARASDAALRVGNRLALLENGPATYSDSQLRGGLR
jgi:hypothetical protein